MNEQRTRKRGFRSYEPGTVAGEMQKGRFHRIEFSISVKDGEWEKSGGVGTEGEESIVELGLRVE